MSATVKFTQAYKGRYEYSHGKRYFILKHLGRMDWELSEVGADRVARKLNVFLSKSDAVKWLEQELA